MTIFYIPNPTQYLNLTATLPINKKQIWRELDLKIKWPNFIFFILNMFRYFLYLLINKKEFCCAQAHLNPRTDEPWEKVSDKSEVFLLRI